MPRDKCGCEIAGSGGEYRLAYDALVLCPGAEPVRPPIPGADHPRVLTLRNLADMDTILAALQSPPVERAVVVGAGYVGLEMAEALCFAGVDVSLVETLPQVMGRRRPGDGRAVQPGAHPERRGPLPWDARSPRFAPRERRSRWRSRAA